MGKKSKNKSTHIDLTEMPEAIPVASVFALLTGKADDLFKLLSKKIQNNKIKLLIKSKKTNDKVSIVIPKEYLEFNKIPYKDPVIPNSKAIFGMLMNKVHTHEILAIMDNLWTDKVLVVLKDKQAIDIIGVQVNTKEIEFSELFNNKINNEYDVEQINIWRPSEICQEVKTKVNLLKFKGNQMTVSQ